MPKAKTKTTKRQTAKNRRTLSAKKKLVLKLKRDVAIFAAVLFVALIWTLLIEQFTSRPSAIGASTVAQTPSNSYKDLDLGVAQKAGYSNSALRVVKDLGASSGVDRAIVSFGVPKDGLFEYAFLTEPTTSPPVGGYPVVILCHGYADPATYSTPGGYFDDMLFYSHHGFLVVKPDYRGQGLSLSKGSASSAFYSMDYNTDVMSLIAALKKTAYINPAAINLWGHSMGAYIALRAAVISPDVKSAVLLSTPGDIAEQAKVSYLAVSDRDNPIASEVRRQQLAGHGSPLENTSYWEKSSPLGYLLNSHAYIQIHVGSDDRTVPPVFSAELNNKLAELNIPHDYFIYSGSGHGLVSDRPLIWQRSLEILKQK